MGMLLKKSFKKIVSEVKNGKEVLNMHCLTDKESIDAAQKLESLKNIDERIEFIADLVGIDGLFSVEEREIKGEVYKFGLNPMDINSWAVEEVTAYAFTRLKNVFYEHEKRRLLQKLENRATGEAKKLLLTEIQSQIQEGIDRLKDGQGYNGVVYMGYEAEKLGEVPYFGRELTQDACTSAAEGAAYYLIEKEFIPEVLKEMELSKDFTNSSHNNGFAFKEQYDIALFFYYSGIYDAIFASTKNNATAASKIIARLAGVPEKAESIRPLFSKVRQYDPSNPESRKLFNLDSLNRVIDMLEESKLESKSLRQIRDKATQD